MNKSTPITILLATVIIVSVAWYYLHKPRYSEEGFSIILTKDSSKLLSDADIHHYNAVSHELTLTDECADRMKKMREPLIGDFVIIVDGEEDLRARALPRPV